MTRRRNPFSGVSLAVDRHGKKRWRLRKTVKGRKISCYLPGPYGSADFRTAYEDALNPRELTTIQNSAAGTFDFVITHYLASNTFARLADSTRTPKRRRLDWIRALIGKARLNDLQPHHVENLMDRKVGPDAANRLYKELGEMYRHAQKRLGFEGTHPTDQVDLRKIKGHGFHTWTADEVNQFREYHRSGTLARLAFEIMLGTGAARQDACAMGRQNIKGPVIWYRRGKTGQDVSLPLAMLPELQVELRQVPLDRVKFFHYTVESFGNWFAEQCDSAELSARCRAHGLRKYGATRLADRGATEFQVMAFLAHKDPREARRYVQAANRTKMVADFLALLQSENVPNLFGGLGKTASQATEKKGEK